MAERPNPEGWKGGHEDFETVWTLFGHRLPPSGRVDPAEAGRISNGAGRISDHEGFC
jgi:hypothetical protein